MAGRWLTVACAHCGAPQRKRVLEEPLDLSASQDTIAKQLGLTRQGLIKAAQRNGRSWVDEARARAEEWVTPSGAPAVVSGTRRAHSSELAPAADRLGYSIDSIKVFLARAGLDWRTATEEEIDNAASDHGSRVLYTIDGASRTLASWSVALGVHRKTILHRVRTHGVSIEESIAYYASFEFQMRERPGRVVDHSRDRRFAANRRAGKAAA